MPVAEVTRIIPTYRTASGIVLGFAILALGVFVWIFVSVALKHLLSWPLVGLLSVVVACLAFWIYSMWLDLTSGRRDLRFTPDGFGTDAAFYPWDAIEDFELVSKIYVHHGNYVGIRFKANSPFSLQRGAWWVRLSTFSGVHTLIGNYYNMTDTKLLETLRQEWAKATQATS